MRRRAFMSLLGCAAAGWPLVARAQPGQMRRVGVLMLYGENDPQGQVRARVFQQELEHLGWGVGRDLQIEYRWGVGDGDWIRSTVAELLKLAPNVILANGAPAMRAAQQATNAVPVIFIGGADPVGDGFVQSLAHPGGNLTGFTVLETSIGGKLLELLKEIAPQIRHVAVIINPDSLSSQHLSASASAAAGKFAVDALTIPVRNAADIETAMMRLGREPANGLIIPPDPSMNTHRELMIAQAARQRLPAIYALRAATAEGGLLSYGVDIPDLFRQAAGYANRVLRGEKPADLPVQQPTKFELVINLTTAKALGLEIPPTLLARADEVIE